MSDFTADDELVLDYLAESREHLGTIEADLLSIELRGANIDESIVNRVFRAAHSIKGGAGFFDLNKIRDLAHKTESVLDLVRSRQMTPNSELVSILLLAFDKLSDLILDYKNSNQADISEFVTALTNLTMASLPQEEKASVDDLVCIQVPGQEKQISVPAFDLKQARRAGKSLYLISCDLIHDVERRGRTPLEVLNSLMDGGTILDALLDLGSAGTLDEEPTNQLVLDIQYATALSRDAIAALLSISSEQVTSLEDSASADTAPPGAEPALVAAVPVPVPVLAPAVEPESPAAPSAAQSSSPAPEATIRVNVQLLDSLMTLAGELVLCRNQLNEAVANKDSRAIAEGAHRVSMVTSELQEGVALTRMQPVGGLFAKFPRLVRELSRELGKEIELKIEGGEVEIDKTLLEGLSDPLTHMIRNAVDHGVETPAKRAAAGKRTTGAIQLRAAHQSGQVVIEITDDGGGLSGEKIAAAAVSKNLIGAEQIKVMSEREKVALIFLPGLSTAAKVSDVSGRGVGMDVVKTNLDKLGGKVEIETAPGKGSTFRIKLPLTLAIIPSLLVSSGGQRFAIPQVSVAELIRIPVAQLEQRIDRAGGAEVLLLRDRLVPLVHLTPATASRGERALNVVLIDTGQFQYGLVVDNLHDTVEIVVKPLGRHLQGLRDYAGATILGDGQVALILDVGGLAERAELSAESARGTRNVATAEQGSSEELHSLLLFHSAPEEPCAIPIELVRRVERVRASQIQYLGGRRTMQYEAASLPLVTLRDVAESRELAHSQQWVVIVFERDGRPLGLLAAEPVDMLETRLSMDAVTLRQTGVAGSMILNGHATLMLDIFELADKLMPPEKRESAMESRFVERRSWAVLVAEDSDFFRHQIQRALEAVGYRVLSAEDGQAGWELLDRCADQVSVVVTDIEMPRLDGLSLTRRIRADARFARLPVIALSSLAGEEEIARGVDAGVTEYQVKLDRDRLLESVDRLASIELAVSPEFARLTRT
jgi:two-component system chemotaxis sensor kinase CheA